jgi:hypothetical protein
MSKIGLHEPFGHLQHKLWQEERLVVKLAVWLPTTKNQESTRPRWNATHRWKALDENYKFALDLIPIGGLRKKLWFFKVAGVQIGTISGLFLESPGIKSHLDAGAVERRKEYYMGEGGGFPWVRAVVSFMSPELLMAILEPKVLQKVN